MGEIRKVGDTYYVEFYARGLLYSQIAGPDPAAAQKLLQEIETKIASGETLTVVRDIDLPVFFGRFLTDVGNQFPARTLERLDLTARHFSIFVKAKYPSLAKLSQVTPVVVESYKAYLVQEDLTPKKVNLTLLLLREILEHGIKIGFINDNPTLHIRLLPMPLSRCPTTARWRLAHDLFAKKLGVGKMSLLLNLSDVARIMYFANLIPLSREDMYK